MIMGKHKMKYKIIAMVVLAIGLSGCGKAPVRNPFEKRAEPKLSELPQLNQQVGEAKVVWTSTGKEQNSIYNKLKPIAYKDTVYSVDERGYIKAVDFNKGKEIWATKVGLNVTAGPSIIDNKLVIAAKQFIVAFDLNNGKELWRKTVASEVVSTPKGQQSTIVVHAMDESVTALSSDNGQILWHVNHSAPALTLRTKSAPAVGQERVVVGLSSGRVVALNIYSGMIEWEYTLTTSRGRSELQRMVDISADPVIIGDVVYVIGYQGKLAALNVSSGNLIWERNISSHQNIAHDTKTLYITDDNHDILAIDRKTGATIWKQSQLATRYVTRPSLLNRYVIVADRGGYIHWLDSSTGHLLGRLKAGEKFYKAPVVANNFILVSGQDGKLSRVDFLKQGHRG